MLAEEVLDAPEAACGDGAFLRVVGDLHRGFGGEGEARGGGEGAEEALQESGHLGGHDGEDDEEKEAGWGERQLGDFGVGLGGRGVVYECGTNIGLKIRGCCLP